MRLGPGCSLYSTFHPTRGVKVSARITSKQERAFPHKVTRSLGCRFTLTINTSYVQIQYRLTCHPVYTVSCLRCLYHFYVSYVYISIFILHVFNTFVADVFYFCHRLCCCNVANLARVRLIMDYLILFYPILS